MAAITASSSHATSNGHNLPVPIARNGCCAHIKTQRVAGGLFLGSSLFSGGAALYAVIAFAAKPITAIVVVSGLALLTVAIAGLGYSLYRMAPIADAKDNAPAAMAGSVSIPRVNVSEADEKRKLAGPPPVVAVVPPAGCPGQPSIRERLQKEIASIETWEQLFKEHDSAFFALGLLGKEDPLIEKLVKKFIREHAADYIKKSDVLKRGHYKVIGDLALIPADMHVLLTQEQGAYEEAHRVYHIAIAGFEKESQAELEKFERERIASTIKEANSFSRKRQLLEHTENMMKVLSAEQLKLTETLRYLDEESEKIKSAIKSKKTQLKEAQASLEVLGRSRLDESIKVGLTLSLNAKLESKRKLDDAVSQDPELAALLAALTLQLAEQNRLKITLIAVQEAAGKIKEENESAAQKAALSEKPPLEETEGALAAVRMEIGKIEGLIPDVRSRAIGRCAPGLPQLELEIRDLREQIETGARQDAQFEALGVSIGRLSGEMTRLGDDHARCQANILEQDALMGQGYKKIERHETLRDQQKVQVEQCRERLEAARRTAEEIYVQKKQAVEDARNKRIEGQKLILHECFERSLSRLVS